MLLARLLLAGLVATAPFASAQAPLPPEAPDVAQAVCDLGLPEPAGGALADLAACASEDARAGPAPAEARADEETFADAQAEEAVADAEALAALAEGFAAEAAADPKGVPMRAPGFLDAVAAWVHEHVVLAVPRLLEGAGAAASGALRGAAGAVGALGLGLEGSVHAGADAAEGAAGALAGAAQGVADAVGDAVAKVGALLTGARAGAPGQGAAAPSERLARGAPGLGGDALAPVKDLLG